MKQYVVSYKIPVREYQEHPGLMESGTWRDGWRRTWAFIQASSKKEAKALIMKYIEVADSIRVEETVLP